ncbi:MAG: acyltransferase [Lachnospiraceae bacterium]|nr:acyltransferase [Lachnospiraceae bacterium]
MTKEQSKSLQGIAILLMIYHHLFLAPVEGTQILFPEMTTKIAMFGRLCVGLFSFVSGYGMYRTLIKEDHRTTFYFRLRSDYGLALRRIMQLYLKVWAVLLVFKGIDFLVLQKPFELQEMVLNLLCVQTSYNSPLWYVQEYVWMMLLVPWLDVLTADFAVSKEKRWQRIWIAIAVSLALLVLVFRNITIISSVIEILRPAILLVFVAAFLIARVDLLSRLGEAVRSRGRGIAQVIGWGSLIVTCILRMLVTTDGSFVRYDVVFVPVFVFGFCLLSENAHRLQRGLRLFGDASAFMWISHAFVFDLTLSPVVDLIPYHLCYYVIEVVLILACAMIFGQIFRKYDIISAKRKQSCK